MSTLYQPCNLPPKFAQDLLDCQIELELNEKLTPVMIMKILELYRIGLQYYESIRSYKYLYFQRKMNSIVKSEKIVNNLNEKKEQIVIQSLTDFKKEQIAINYINKNSMTQSKQGTITNYNANSFNKQKQLQISLDPNQKLNQSQKKATNPFKRHIEQKIQQHYNSNQQRKCLQFRQKQRKQQQFKKLQQLEQKQKQILMNTQINQKTELLSSNQQIKKIINQYDQKFNEFDQKINKNILEQQEQFMKKLNQRRSRVKSNTDKRRLTKSFSQIQQFVGQKNMNLIDFQIDFANYKEEQNPNQNNIEQNQLKKVIQIKNPRRKVLSTKMFSSFVEQKTSKKKQENEFDDFVFQQISDISVNTKLSDNKNISKKQEASNSCKNESLI